MVISNLKTNTLIEARHYDHGYGKVHEIELGNVFNGINTYQDLLTAYRNKKSLHRKDIHGTLKQTYPLFKILRLSSVWDATMPKNILQ